MITIAIVTLLGAVVLLAALFTMIRGTLRQQSQTSAFATLPLEELLPRHARHFPQIRRVLDREDEIYLRARLDRKELKKWRAERRAVVLEFLDGLREDFQKLSILARRVAALSPKVSRRQEAELLRYALRFRILLARVRLRIILGELSAPELGSLVDLVSRLARDVEAAMIRATEAGPSQLGAGASA